MIFRNHQCGRGFTLVETLVAVSVLLLIVVGPLTITARTTKSATFASEQVVAHFLAQEGLELAQKARDELLLEHFGGAVTNPWERFVSATGTYAACLGVSGCGLSLNNSQQVVLSNCATSATECVLRFSTTANDVARYRHGPLVAPLTNSVPQYTRTIRFYPVGSNPVPQIRVVSEVTWRSGTILASQSVQFETYLFNVYERN